MSQLTKRLRKLEKKKEKKMTWFRADVIVTAVLLIIGLSVSLIFMFKMNSEGDAILDNLVARVDRLGNFVDPLNEVAVSSISDVGYYYQKDKVFIVYGKMKMSLPKDLRKTEIDKLKLIGITVSRDGGGKYVFKFRGQKMSEIKTTK